MAALVSARDNHALQPRISNEMQRVCMRACVRVDRGACTSRMDCAHRSARIELAISYSATDGATRDTYFASGERAIVCVGAGMCGCGAGHSCGIASRGLEAVEDEGDGVLGRDRVRAPCGVLRIAGELPSDSGEDRKEVDTGAVKEGSGDCHVREEVSLVEDVDVVVVVVVAVAVLVMYRPSGVAIGLVVVKKPRCGVRGNSRSSSSSSVAPMYSSSSSSSSSSGTPRMRPIVSERAREV